MRNVPYSTLLVSSLVYFANHFNILGTYYKEVDIAQGRLRGSSAVSRNGRLYLEFLGIPYAQPPLDDLRFEPPQPPENWTGVRMATTYGSSCLQYEFLTHFFVGDENCLTLNVYTHQVLSKHQINDAKLKPVVVFIYGGLFMSGISMLYRGKYFLDEDVVLVTFNYRVNSFGFLNTGDEVIRGNMGMKDQVMALKWVQQNIRYFGGNPNLVTIVGQSAGGASVHYHLLSNMSRGLFHRAISQSGTVLQIFGLAKTPRRQAHRLGKALNCPTENSIILAKCLKTRSARAIAKFHREYLEPVPDKITLYGPSVEAVNDENAFLVRNPREILESGSIVNKVPWIVGVTNAEGILMAGYLIKRPNRLSEANLEWNRVAPIFFDYVDHPMKDNISKTIRSEYFQETDITADSFPDITRIFSDYVFNLPMDESVRLHSKVAQVYPYIFSYEGDAGLAKILLRMNPDRGGFSRSMDFVFSNAMRWMSTKMCPNCIEEAHGVCHADELVYQFNIPGISDEINPGSADYGFSNDFMKLWMSFIEEGKPSDFRGVKWLPIQPNNSNLPYLNLDRTASTLFQPFENITKFWSDLKLRN